MEPIRSFRRKQTLKQVQSTVGTRKGRSSRALGLAPHEDHAARELMGSDATPNLRVWQMFDEASVFDHKLDHARHLLTDFEHATDEFLSTLEPILRAPLPRVWDSVEGGLAEPTRATISHRHAHTVGGDASQAGLEEARSEFHNRLRGHILRPLEQWSEGLEAVEDRLPELAKLRKRVVKSSRNLAHYNAKYEEHMAKEVGHGSTATGAAAAAPGRTGSIHTRQTGGGMRGIFGACMHPQVGHGGSRRHRDDISSSGDEEDVSEVDSEIARQVASEEAGMKLNYKHRKLEAARGDYNELEQLVAGQLAGLARDASWLKSYLVSSMLLGKEAMQMAVVTLGTTKQPLPGFTGRVAAPTEHGEMGYNYELAAAMPPKLPSLNHSQRTWGVQLLPHISDTGLTAHKATASPLELSAVPTAQALQPVTPIPESAAGIRMSDIAHTSAVREYEAGLRSGDSYREPSVSATVIRPISGSAVHAEPHHREHERYESSAVTGGSGYRSEQHESKGVMGTIKDAAGSVAHAVGLGGSGEDKEDDTRREAYSSDTGRYDKGVTRREEYSDIDMAGSRDQRATADAASELRQGGGETVVCGRKEFSEVEDRPYVKERVTRILEHNPVEKEYVTQVKFAGEHALPSGEKEMLGAPQTRIVETTPPGPKCPQGMHQQHGITA